MRWKEESIVLSVRNFGEGSRIVTVLNRTWGKTCGLVKNLRQVIQLGDISDVTWSGKSHDQLGVFKIENVVSTFAFVFSSPLKVCAIESACTLCINGLPEKAPHEKLFESMKSLLLSIAQSGWLSDYVFFEKKFLSEIGVGLDFSRCAVTGRREGLFYVSPRTGRAVIKEVGDKYKDKLFILPKFLVQRSIAPTDSEILSALSITGHFLKMYFGGINNKQLPLSRSYLIQNLLAGEVNDSQYVIKS